MVEDFALPLNEVDPRVPRVIVNEGDEISTPAKTNILCRSPYIRMYQVELVLASIMLVGERKSVLLPELARFTNLCLPATKFGQSEYHLFRLQILKPLVVDVAYPLVPQVDIRLGFLSPYEHCGATVSRVEDEHPPISAPLRNNTTFFLNEAPEVCKPDLHPLVDDLSDRHQVLRDCRNV